MELYLQMGHGMQGLSYDLIKSWGHGTIIISPVNIAENRIEYFAKKIHSIGGNVLFDPQMFYPKNGHVKLQQYDYWPQSGCSVTEENTNYQIDQGILKINNTIGTSQIILPGIEIEKRNIDYSLNWICQSVNYFKRKTEKELLVTLCLSANVIQDSSLTELLSETIRSLSVAGCYIIPHPANDEYIISDPQWVIGIMKLISCIKLAKKKVIVGYTNHQGLIYALAHADAIASGTYMNTRSFVPKRFKYPKDDEIKKRSTWYYLPTAFTEYRAVLLDIAMQRNYLDEFSLPKDYKNPYSEMLFGGAKPSSTNYNETNSFKHYLYCLKTQCEVLTKDNYKDTYSQYEFMLNAAENQIKNLKKRGMFGSNRDFMPAIEPNRVALCANDEDYGFKLDLEWKYL